MESDKNYNTRAVAHMRPSKPQVVPAFSYTSLVYDLFEAEKPFLFDPAKCRLTITQEGFYYFNGIIAWDGNFPKKTPVTILLKKNGSPLVDTSAVLVENVPIGFGFDDLRGNAGDYYELLVLHGSGRNEIILPGYTFLNVRYVENNQKAESDDPA